MLVLSTLQATESWGRCLEENGAGKTMPHFPCKFTSRLRPPSQSRDLCLVPTDSLQVPWETKLTKPLFTSLDSEITESLPSSERRCLRPVDQPCLTLFYDSLTFSSSSTIVGGILPLTEPSKSCTGEGGGIRWFKSFHGMRSKYENVNALVSLCDNER